MAAVELDIAAAASRHNNVIDRPNAVHLFSDTWPVRRWANAWVSEQKTQASTSSAQDYFAGLEKATAETLLAKLPTPPPSQPFN